MKAGNGNHFEQSYNAQAAVEVESRLIVGERVSQAPNDKQELVPTLAVIPAEVGSVAAALVDSGFFSEKAVRQIERAEPGAPAGPCLCGRGEDRASPQRGRFGSEVRTGVSGGGGERQGSDAAPVENDGGQEALQVAPTDSGAGVRHN